jgi:PilZ domain
MLTLTAAAPSSSPTPPRGVELRVWERFSCGLETSCQPLAARGDNDMCWSTRIKDISVGGMGLVLTRRFERGTSLAIEIPATASTPSDTLLAKVMHVTRLPDGQWLLGCAFVSILGDDEVQNLLRLGSTQAHEAKQTVVIPEVVLVGSVPGKGETIRLAQPLFVNGHSWPLAGGVIFKVSLGPHYARKARLKVDRCYQLENRWIVRYTFIDDSAPEVLRWFGQAE